MTARVDPGLVDHRTRGRCHATDHRGHVKPGLDADLVVLDGLGALHRDPHLVDLACVQIARHQRALLEYLREVLFVDHTINGLMESRAHRGIVAVTDGFPEQIAKRLLIEQAAEHVEDLVSAERFALDFEFTQ